MSVRLTGVSLALLFIALTLTTQATTQAYVLHQEDDTDPAPTHVRRDVTDALTQSITLPDAGFTFRYPPGWTLEALPGGVAVLNDGLHRVTFYGQPFLAANYLEDIPTLEELADDTLTILGDYTVQSFVMLKFDERPAVELHAVAADGSVLTLWAVTFSDERLGVLTFNSDDPLLLESVAYPIAATFDIPMPEFGALESVYIAEDMTHTFHYPTNWTMMAPMGQSYVTISDGVIALNLYTGDALDGLDLTTVAGPVTLCEAVMDAIGWYAGPASRLRIDDRAAARLIYENPIYDSEGRLYAIFLDNHTRQLGYVDVVALSPVANPATYEALVFDLLATWRLVSEPGV